ncbi:hypothetical protein BHM03_00025852 [Ensete ventricosum]|nr:hypothetical protein BHM03_00025852 [Ensete ventricosum]
MSQEHSTPVNPREDARPTTQPTSGGAYRPLLPLPSFRGEYTFPHRGVILELNDSELTPPPPNPRTPMVTPEAFQGLTNQVQAITGMLQAIIPYILQLAQQSSSRPPATPLPQIRTTLLLNEPHRRLVLQTARPISPRNPIRLPWEMQLSNQSPRLARRHATF